MTTLSTINYTVPSDVLLIYVYANVHEHAYGNLKYFIETAVREHDSVDYIFILQQTENKPIDETQLPPLPRSNAFYFQHENNCFDYGTMGWFLDRYSVGNPWQKSTLATPPDENNRTDRIFNLRQYKYFILMNSSIRGPFFPPYFLQFMSDYRAEFHRPFPWYSVFTKRINERVKLVGSTINCNPSPHVQSYLVTTDFTGLSLLLKSATTSAGRIGAGVFGCYPTKSDTITICELGISATVLDAGYLITSLMSKHQTIDFAKKSDYKCHVFANPYSDKSVDGTSLEPYDVVFVKYNAKKTTTDAQDRAKLYERWMKARNMTKRTSW
jgi:hypothetical protein